MTLKITVEMDNAAFSDGSEAGRILRALAETVDDEKPLRDVNGNKVGVASVS